jgi:hypothetical protein
LKNYKEILNNGYIRLKDNDIHKVRIEVNDTYQNTSILNLKLRMKTEQKELKSNITIDANMRTKLFSWNNENNFENDNFKISIKERTLYETINFRYKKKDSISGVYGNIHMCHYDYVPLHKKATISIKSKIPIQLKEKAYIAKVNNEKYSYVGGKWKNNYLTTKSSELGDFTIVIDTINPIIKGVNIYPGKEIKKQTTIKCTIEDRDSGIKKYNGKINDQWILMDYDHKRKLLKYNFDKILKKGNNTFVLEVEDMVGNIKIYKAKFSY